MTSAYYNTNAKEFYDGTIDVDMNSLYSRFVPLLPTNANIVDAGCGSGRDTKYFVSKGFNVTAFDASEKLVALAEQFTNQVIQHSTFLDFQSETARFDAIWACASLLHVPYNDLARTLSHLSQSLKSGGIFYCSFKYGDNEVERNGRRFTNLNETELRKLIRDTSLTIEEQWITSDLRVGREDEKWLNVILKKVGK